MTILYRLWGSPCDDATAGDQMILCTLAYYKKWVVFNTDYRYKYPTNWTNRDIYINHKESRHFRARKDVRVNLEDLAVLLIKKYAGVDIPF